MKDVKDYTINILRDLIKTLKDLGPIFWLLISEIYPLNIRGASHECGDSY
jgi:hypothetical protein